MGSDKPTLEDLLDGFKKSLDDVAVIAEALSRHCQTIEELVGVVKLAEDNPGQLRLLYSLVTQQPKK